MNLADFTIMQKMPPDPNSTPWTLHFGKQVLGVWIFHMTFRDSVTNSISQFKYDL